MTSSRAWRVLPLAGCMAVVSACAGPRSQSAELTKTAQERSQEAYKRASEAQAKAAEQDKRAAQAHQRVLDVQQQLREAQAREEQETLKAQQLRAQSDRSLQDASQIARQAQGVATMGQPAGLQTTQGRVARASSNEVVLETEGGRRMTFGVDPGTRVLVGGAESSTEEIQQGADALVSYETSGGRRNAITIQVNPAGGMQQR